MIISIDFWALLTVLLVTALLQEFIIKPTVEFIKKYYHKSRKHIENALGNNNENRENYQNNR